MFSELFTQNVINITVRNIGATAGAWTAFGYNAGSTSPSGGTAITVNSSPNSMDFANRESQQNPYVTKKIKIKVSGNAQFNSDITITGQVMGRTDSVTISPLDFESPTRGIADLIEVAIPNFVINGGLSISGNIDALTTMNIVIEYDDLVKPKKKKSNFVEQSMPQAIASVIEESQLPEHSPVATALKSIRSTNRIPST